MELRRHIDGWLDAWRRRPNRKPVLVKGIRQSGKTHSILSFAKKNYQTIVYLNFWDAPDLVDAFAGELDVSSIIKELSVKLPLPELAKGSTVFIYDEVQECPRALLSLKSAGVDSGYDFIASGSYLGIRGYVVSDDTPKPVGSVEEFDMRTLDFEEFLWAKGYQKEQVSYLKEAFLSQTPLSKSMHDAFTSLFREYLCIGGFPEAVSIYMESGNIQTALQTVRRITNDLQDDFGRRRGKDNRPLFKPNEVARIRSAFSLIPSFLAKENKRYIVSKIEGRGAKDAGKDAISYLIDADVATKAYNLETPSIPLSVNLIASQYKLYPADIGMLVGMLEDGTTNAILSGQLGMSKGMLYEALVADALYKRGGRLFYFSKEGKLELDFLINFKGEAAILEVKAVSGNAKSAKTVLKHPEHYGKTRLIQIKDANIGYANDVLTIPHYMAHLLFDWSPTLPLD